MVRVFFGDARAGDGASPSSQRHSTVGLPLQGCARGKRPAATTLAVSEKVNAVQYSARTSASETGNRKIAWGNALSA